jgi:transposase-like protein
LNKIKLVVFSASNQIIKPPFGGFLVLILSSPERRYTKTKCNEQLIISICQVYPKDYTMSFKLQVVNEIENGTLTASQEIECYGIQARSTVSRWMCKYGNFDWHHKTPFSMAREKTSQQLLLELEADNLLLRKQNKTLERQLDQAYKKAIILDMIIDFAEKEYNIPI